MEFIWGLGEWAVGCREREVRAHLEEEEVRWCLVWCRGGRGAWRPGWATGTGGCCCPVSWEAWGFPGRVSGGSCPPAWEAADRRSMVSYEFSNITWEVVLLSWWGCKAAPNHLFGSANTRFATGLRLFCCQGTSKRVLYSSLLLWVGLNIMGVFPPLHILERTLHHLTNILLVEIRD